MCDQVLIVKLRRLVGGYEWTDGTPRAVLRRGQVKASYDDPTAWFETPHAKTLLEAQPENWRKETEICVCQVNDYAEHLQRTATDPLLKTEIEHWRGRPYEWLFYAERPDLTAEIEKRKVVAR